MIRRPPRRPDSRRGVLLVVRRAPLLVAGLALAAGGAAGQTTQDRLRQLEQDLAESEAAQRALAAEADQADRSLSDLQHQLVEAAQGITDQHQVLLDVEAGLGTLEADEADRTGRLAAERGRLATLVRGLYSLSRMPRDALMLRPDAPVDALRAARLLSAAAPEIEARMVALRAELDGLAETRQALERRRSQAEALRAELNIRIDDLTALVDRRTALLAATRRQMTAAAEQQRDLAGAAADLRDLLARIEARQEVAADLPAGPPPAAGTQLAMAAPPPAAPGTVVLSATTRPMPDVVTVGGVLLPASGEILRRFGDPDANGEAGRGLVLRSFPGAPVVSPLDGVVRFAGPFRGYGQILIIDHGGGYHSMIAGLGRVDAAAGQDVLAGEPVGAAALPQVGQNEDLTVYFEFRRNGQPIDPLEGLAAAQRRG